MTDHEPVTPEECRAVYAAIHRKAYRVVAFLRNVAALDPDEQPAELQSIVTDARRLLSETGFGVDCPDDDTPRRSDATGR